MQKKNEGMLASLKLLFEDIVQLKEHLTTENSVQYIRKRIRQYSQMVIWGQKNNNSDFFNFFCESRTLEIFFELFVKAKSKELIIQIIKSISMLIVNISSPDSIHYFLSHNTIKNFLVVKFPQMHTQIAQYYINFLKTLAQKLDQTTIKLLYNKKFPSFSLAWQTIRFYNHPQPLIRTTSRNIILTLIKLKDDSVNKYLSNFPFLIYYTHFSCLIRQQWIGIDQCYEMGLKYQHDKKESKLKELIEDNYDLLLFLDDFFKVAPLKVKQTFLNAFIYVCVNTLVRTLTSHHKQILGINVILYMLGMMIKIIEDNLLIDFLIMILLGKYTHIQLSEKINNDIDIISHEKEWSFKNFWDKYDSEIRQFNESLFQNENNNQKQITIRESNISKIENLLFSDYQNPKFMKFIEEVTKIQKIYGMALFSSRRYETPLQLLESILTQIKQTSFIDLHEFNQNPTKDIIFSFMSSKDDQLVMLTLELILNIMKNKSASKTALEFAGLYIHQKTNEQYTRITFQKFLKYCINVIKIDPPNFKLFTIINAIEIIKLISSVYEDRSQIIDKQMQNDLIIALKIAIQRVKDNLEPNITIIQIFLKSQRQFNKIRTKGLAAYGFALYEQEITDIYQKSNFTFQEKVQRDFHHYFLIRNLMQFLFPEQYKKKQDLQLSSKFKDVSWEQAENGTNCYIKIDKEKNEKAKIVFQKSIYYVCVYSEHSWIVKFYCDYTNCKVEFDQEQFKKLKIKTLSKEVQRVTLTFQNPRISASLKKLIQQQKQRLLKDRIKQIDINL